MTARKAAASSDSQSWDAFWSEVSGARTEVIRGVEVRVPSDVPLVMEQRIEELSESDAEGDVAELLKLLFGADVFETWRQNGMGMREMQTVIAWGMAHAGGREMTFAEAHELVQTETAAAGKAPNRATRRKAASKPRSAAGGGRSRQTSSASTASARKTSRS